MDFTPLRELSQGIEGVRKQYEGMVSEAGGRGDKVVAAKKFLCRYDLRYLCRDVLGYSLWSPFHDDLQKFIDNSVKKRKLILVPRGHLKTSLITIGHSIQRILQTPEIRILLASYTWNMARDYLGELQAYLTGASSLDKWFGNFRPNLRTTSGWNKDTITICQRKRPMKESTITTAGVDKNLVGQHYDLIILDDIVAEDNITTKEQRDKIKRFYRNCLSLLEPDGEVIMIGTTWHEDDIYNDIRDPQGDWHGYYDIYVRRAIEKGKIVFPERFSEDTIKMLKKELGPYKFSSQYLLNPYPEEDMDFKKEWIKRYDELPVDNYYISVTLDPSLGNENSDFAGIAASAINAKGQIYVLEARRFRCHVDLIPNEVVKTIKKIELMGLKVNVFGLESFQFQQVLGAPIRKAFLMNKIDVYVDELPKFTLTSKSDRIRTLIPKYSGGSIWHKELDMRDLEDEMLRWRPTVRNNKDDILDALAWQAIMYWERKPKHNEVVKVRPYSFEWWMNLNANKGKDIFSDMRYRKDNPGVLN